MKENNIRSTKSIDTDTDSVKSEWTEAQIDQFVDEYTAS